jgi:hypothetical protein
MSLLLKRKSARGHAHPALKKKRGSAAKMTELAVRSWAWSPDQEERRLSDTSFPTGRREVDRAKEPRDDDDGGPDA